MIVEPATDSSTGVAPETGASATEYGLLVVAIAALIVVVVFALGGAVSDMFSGSCDTIKGKASTTSSCS